MEQFMNYIHNGKTYQHDIAGQVFLFCEPSYGVLHQIGSKEELLLVCVEEKQREEFVKVYFSLDDTNQTFHTKKILAWLGLDGKGETTDEYTLITYTLGLCKYFQRSIDHVMSFAPSRIASIWKTIPYLEWKKKSKDKVAKKYETRQEAEEGFLKMVLGTGKNVKGTL